MANEDYNAQIKRLSGGNQLDIGPTGIISNDEVHWVGDVTWTLTAASTAYKKTVTAQLLDGSGTAITGFRQVFVTLFADSSGTAYITPTTLMIAGPTSSPIGAILALGNTTAAINAPTLLLFRCSSGGQFDFTWTDTGCSTVFPGLTLPGGLVDLSTVAISTTST